MGSIDGGLATRTGISGRTKARKKDVQVDGARDHLSQKKSDERRSQSIHQTLSIEGLKNRACKSSVVHGYYVYPYGERLYVHDCLHRCVQQENHGLGHQ